MAGPSGEQVGAREIPTTYVGISVSAVAGSTSLAAYSGTFVFLQASGADVTVLRGAGVSAPTAGQGLLLLNGERSEEFWVDPAHGLTLNHIASGAGTLKILYAADAR